VPGVSLSPATSTNWTTSTAPALVLHEARVLERKTELGKFKPELLPTGPDGHLLFNSEADGR